MASFENMVKADASISRRPRARLPRRPQTTSTLSLSNIIDEETVANQQTGIARRAGDQLSYIGRGEPGYTAADAQRLETIKEGALPDWVPEWSFGPMATIGRLGMFLDRGAQALRMQVNDAVNLVLDPMDLFNGEQILQFTLDDYWDILAGNREELARDNPGIGMDDGDFSFKDMFNLGFDIGDSGATLRWEQTDSWLNKWGRSTVLLVAEGLLDPINLFTGGLSGTGKVAAGRLAKAGLQSAGINVMEGMIKYGDDILEAGVDAIALTSRTTGKVRSASLLEKRIFSDIQKRSVVLRAANPEMELGPLVKRAAGWTDELPTLIKGAERGVPIRSVIDEAMPDANRVGQFLSSEVASVDEVAAGITSGAKVSWFGMLDQEIQRTIGNKLFHSQNPLWRDWVDHAKVMSKADPAQSLLVTTGGITFGVPFGKRVARQANVPYLTDFTRGKVSWATRPIKGKIGGQRLDDFTYAWAQKFNRKSYSMRLARLANEIQPGRPVDIEMNAFAAYSELAGGLELLEVIKPHIGGAGVVRNSQDQLKERIRTELKGAGIPKRKGGAEAEQAILQELNDAAFAGRTLDFDKLDLPFTLSDDLIGEITDIKVKAALLKKPVEEFVSKFVPDLANAIASGQPYTPLRLSVPGELLMRELSMSIDGGSPSMMPLIEEMRKVNRALKGEGTWVDAMDEVRRSLEVKARATGILETGDRLSVEDVHAFFQMIEESTPSQMLLGKQLGEASPFKVRKVGNNGMWVFELEDGVVARTVFEDPEMMNRKMTSMLYALTADLDSKKVTKYRKLTADRLFDTDIANGVNYWYTTTMEAVMNRVRGGIMLRTKLIMSSSTLFDLPARTRMMATEGVADAEVQLLMALQRAHDALKGDTEIFEKLDPDILHGMADDVVMPPNPVRTIEFGNEVGITLDEFLFNDEAFVDYVDDFVKMADDIGSPGVDAPAQWQGAIDELVAQGSTVANAEAQIVRERLALFQESMYGMVETVRAHMERKYVSIVDEAAAIDDVATTTILENNLQRELAEANKSLSTFRKDFLKSYAGRTVEPATQLLDADAVDKVVAAASQIVGDGGKKFRERQVTMLRRQVGRMTEGHESDLLRAEIEMYDEVDRIVANMTGGAAVGDLEIDFISGGANGVDMMTLIYADKVRAARKIAEGRTRGPTQGPLRESETFPRDITDLPAQHKVREIGGSVPAGEGRATSEMAELGGPKGDPGSGLAGEVAEQDRLGLKPMEGTHYKKKPTTNHPARTMKNVDDADATIVYYPGVGGARARSYISGGSADTVYYAMKGVYPEFKEGYKRTFTDAMLRTKFMQIAEGVWVLKDPDAAHRPVMVIGYVAREHVRPDLTGAQHSAVQTWLHDTATDGRVKLNMAGTRAESYDRKLFRTDQVGNMIQKMDPAEAKALVAREVELGTLDEFKDWVLSDPLMRARYLEQTKAYTDSMGVDVSPDDIAVAEQQILAQAVTEMSRPLELPAVLKPGHPEYTTMRFGELLDGDGLVVRSGIDPRRQTVQEFTDAFNTYLSWLSDGSPFRFGGGNWITAEDVIRYNVDSVQHGQVRYHRALEHIRGLRGTSGKYDKVLTALEKLGVPAERMEAVLKHSAKVDNDPEEALARLAVSFVESTDRTVVDLDGRLKGIMSGQPTVRVGGSIGAGDGALTDTPVVKALTVNKKNARIVRELAVKYRVLGNAEDATDLPVAEVWDALRAYKLANKGTVVEEIPAPFDLIETPASIQGSPLQWVYDRNGDVLGPSLGTAGEYVVDPVRVYTLKEQRLIREMADENRIAGRKLMEINELVAELKRFGALPPQLDEGRMRWVDVLGQEMDVWEEAFTSKYPQGVDRQMSQRSNVPTVDGGDRVDVFKEGVPAAESMFTKIMASVRDRGVGVSGDTIIDDVFGADLDILTRYTRIAGMSVDELETIKANAMETINRSLRSRSITESQAKAMRKESIDSFVAGMAMTGKKDVTRTTYDVMEAYLETLGFNADEMDDVISVLMQRYGMAGSELEIPTTGTVKPGRQGIGPDASIDDAAEMWDLLDDIGYSRASIDKSERYARFGFNPETEGSEIGEVLFDGRTLDDAEVMYAQYVVNNEGLYFEPDASIRLPAVDRMKNKKYYSSDYEAGRYADLSRRQARDLEEAGGYQPKLVTDDKGIPVLDAKGNKQYEAGDWVPAYGSKRQVVVPAAELEIDRFSRDLDVTDPTVAGGLGPTQIGGGEPQTQAINFGPDIPRADLDQRDVLTPGVGFTEKMGQAVSPRAGKSQYGSLGLEDGVNRLMDMVINPSPGSSADTLMYDAAVRSFTKAYQLEMTTTLNVVETRAMQRIAGMFNISTKRANEAWRKFRTTGDPEYLFDPDLLKSQALARLSTNTAVTGKELKLNDEVLDGAMIKALREMQESMSRGVMDADTMYPGVFTQVELADVAQFVVGSQRASAAAIKKQFKFTAKKANRILEILEANGVVGGKVRGKMRQVLVADTESFRPATSGITLTDAERGQLAEFFPEFGSIPEVIEPSKLNTAISALQMKIAVSERLIADASQPQIRDVPVPVSLTGRPSVVKGYDKPAGAINVGRGTPFGNPFIVKGVKSKFKDAVHPFLKSNDGSSLPFVEVATTADAVAQYKAALWGTIKTDPVYARRVASLEGETLWYMGRQLTDGEPSHALVLADATEFLNSPAGSEFLGEAAASPTSLTPPPITGGGEKVVGQTLDDLLGPPPARPDADVREILDDAPDLTSPASVSTLDSVAEQSLIGNRREKLRFLNDIKARSRGTQVMDVATSTRAKIDAIHPGGVNIDDMPSFTQRIITSEIKTVFDALERGGVLVSSGVRSSDAAVIRRIRKNGAGWLVDDEGGYINSLFENPYRPIGRTVSKARMHPLFTSIDPETMVTTGVPYRQAASEMDAVGLYHELVWDWIEASPRNAKMVRDLHGRTFVSWTPKSDKVPNEANVLAEAADWLYGNVGGRPQNVYRKAAPLNELDDMILNEALEAWKVNAAIYERILTASERASKAVTEIEQYQSLARDEMGDALTTLALSGTDTARQRARIAVLSAAAKDVYGDDAYVSIHKTFTTAKTDDIGKGTTKRYIRIRVPGDDVAAVTARDDGPEAFTKVLNQYLSGESTADDLAAEGLDMVVQAGEINKKISTIIDKIAEVADRATVDAPQTKTAARAQADAQQTLEDYSTLLNLIWRAIGKGKPKQLRKFIGIGDDLVLDATPEWLRLEKLLGSGALSADDEQLVRFWVEAGMASEWEWGDQATWMRAWQTMRKPHDGPISSPTTRQAERAVAYDDAVTQATKLDDAAATARGLTDRLGITKPQHRRSIRFIEALILDLEQDTNLIRAHDAGGYGTPNVDDVRLDPRRFPGKKVQGPQGSGYVYTPGRAGNHESYAELLVSIYSTLDQLKNDDGLMSLNDFVMQGADDTMGDIFNDESMRALNNLHQQSSTWYDSSQPWWNESSPRAGMVSTDSLGLAGVLNGYFINPVVGAEMMAADRRLAAMASQRGTFMVLETAQRIQDWWKRAATLPKVTFHIRNMIGGIWNNMMIGAGPLRHLEVMPDVFRFLRARKKATLKGWSPTEGTGDLFEDVVISAVSEKNRDMFRQAAKLDVFDSSFASTLGTVIPKHGKWDRANPFARNFLGYRVGGDMMEGVEGVLRMAAFSRYFDPASPYLSGQVARTMVNMVHFDYNATTATEDSIKKFIPFWVWTRNNLPLQMRMLFQQPRWLNTYEKSRRYWNDEAIADDDPNSRYLKNQGWVVPWLRRENDQGWAQMVMRPDLPFGDLIDLPLFTGYRATEIAGVETPFGNDMTNLTSWSRWATDMMGPIGQLGMDLVSEQDRSTQPGYVGDVTPVGINAIANLLGQGTQTPQGDRLLPKYVSQTAMTLMPFWYEYFDLAGIPANSPYRGANQGILAGEENVISPQKSALVSASKLGTGFGFRWFTPKDVFFIDRELETYMDQLNKSRKIQASPPTRNE